MPKRARFRQEKGPRQAAGAGQQRVFRHRDIFQHDLAGDAGAQGEFAVDARRGEAFGAALDQKAADFSVQLGPDHRDIGDRRIGDPHFRAIEAIARAILDRARDHAAGIGAMIRFGETETADQFAARQAGQIFLLLRLGLPKAKIGCITSEFCTLMAER